MSLCVYDIVVMQVWTCCIANAGMSFKVGSPSVFPFTEPLLEHEIMCMWYLGRQSTPIK